MKIGHASNTVRELVDENPTSTLLHDYSESVRHTAAIQTMRTPAVVSDTIAKVNFYGLSILIMFILQKFVYIF